MLFFVRILGKGIITLLWTFLSWHIFGWFFYLPLSRLCQILLYQLHAIYYIDFYLAFIAVHALTEAISNSSENAYY